MIDAEETRLLTQLAEVRAAKAVLKRVCGLTDPPHGPSVPAEAPPAPAPAPKEPPGKPEPRPRPSGPGRTKPGPAGDMDRPLRVARFLAENGPHRVGEMDAAGVSPQPAINAVFKSHPSWFRKTGPGLRCPWEVTEAGRAAATAASSSAS